MMANKHTAMYVLGYRWYVYLGPGSIHYFRTFEEAQRCADENDGRIGEVD
jgi:hypothetical protein